MGTKDKRKTAVSADSNGKASKKARKLVWQKPAATATLSLTNVRLQPSLSTPAVSKAPAKAVRAVKWQPQPSSGLGTALQGEKKVAAGKPMAADKVRAKLLKLAARLEAPGQDAALQARNRVKFQRKLAQLAAVEDPDQGSDSDNETGDRPAAGLAARLTYSALPPSTNGLAERLGVSSSDPAEKARRTQRQQRFLDCQTASTSGRQETLVEARSRSAGAVGQNEALEKEYLRLTSMPVVDAVRPPAVLQRALLMVQRKWTDGADYHYVCEQLKSIRQDLTVQHIRNGLTVAVYETHARIALESADFAEYNQCQTALADLYADQGSGNEMEFTAYRVLYAASHARETLTDELRRLSPAAIAHPYLQHALQVCNAVRVGDYHAFFCLYVDAPRMAPYLMDALIASVRQQGLAAMVAGYGPGTVPLEFVAVELGLETVQEAAEFITEAGAVVDLGADVLDAKLSKCAVAGPARPKR